MRAKKIVVIHLSEEEAAQIRLEAEITGRSFKRSAHQLIRLAIADILGRPVPSIRIVIKRDDVGTGLDEQVRASFAA